jgi:hypothetical protein
VLLRKVSVLFASFALFALGAAFPDNTFEGFPAVVLSNGKLELTIMRKGGTMTRLVLADDPEKVSPYWNPMRFARDLGKPVKFDGGAGHFVCVDGFGPASAEERAAGLPGHGEAHMETFEISPSQTGAVTSLKFTAKLSIVQEVFTRTFQAVNGESVIYIDSELENLMGFDRPINWAEHATLGAPFLASGLTVVDLSGSRSRTRPYDRAQQGPLERRLASGQEFTWPMAPALNGKPIDIRRTPYSAHYLDHAATLLDPKREFEWVTGINLQKRLILGYVFRRADYPWLQYWGNYPPDGRFARGMEFSTQPFDVPRREVISKGPMFDTPTYRWLPAKSKITSRFLLFYSRLPEGFQKVDDITVANGQILVEDRANRKQVRLAASRGL